MHDYDVRDVERLVNLPRSTIRALVEAGFVSPARGPRNSWRFSFQDLIVLRTAQALTEARVPRRRITRSVKELRRLLPESMPISGLTLTAEADRVVVKEGARRWAPESGQYLLSFEGDPAAGSMNVHERDQKKAPEGATRDMPEGSQTWFDEGVALEGRDAEAALLAYERAVAADPSRLDARINLGCLLHEAGRLEEAEKVYRDARLAYGRNPLLLFNLGVLLDDMDRKEEAVEAYEAALRADPTLADCHYNLALLYEDLGMPHEAIRHLATYRKLTAGTRG